MTFDGNQKVIYNNAIMPELQLSFRRGEIISFTDINDTRINVKMKITDHGTSDYAVSLFTAYYAHAKIIRRKKQGDIIYVLLKQVLLKSRDNVTYVGNILLFVSDKYFSFSIEHGWLSRVEEKQIEKKNGGIGGTYSIATIKTNYGKGKTYEQEFYANNKIDEQIKNIPLGSYIGYVIVESPYSYTKDESSRKAGYGMKSTCKHLEIIFENDDATYTNDEPDIEGAPF